MSAAVWGPVVSVVVIAVANLIAYAANENSWIFRRCLKPLGARPILFISNRAACVGRHTRPTSYWAFDLLDPAHLVKSNCLSTPMLLVLHTFTFLYWVVTVVVDVAIEYYRVWCDNPSCGRKYGAYGEWASYLTNWSISILGIAGLVALADTARQLRRERHERRQHSMQQAGSAPGAAAAGTDRQKTDIAVGQTHDTNNPRDSRQQMAVLPSTNPAGHVQLASINQQLPTSSTGATPAAVYDDESGLDEPGCCLFPRSSRHSRAASPHTAGAAAGSRPAVVSNNHAGVTNSLAGSGAAADTVVVVHDGGSSSGTSSGSNAGTGGVGQVDCRQVLKRKWDCLSCTHCILMEVATTAAFFVSFWYWIGVVVIGQSSFTVNGGTLMAHGGNVVVALLQVVLTRLPIVSYHFQVLLWYATLYSIFLWIFGGITDVWRYGLNFEQPRPAGVFIIIPVVTFVMFLLWFYAALIREGVICVERKAVDKHHERKERRHHRQEQQQQQAQQHAQQHAEQHTSSLQPVVIVPFSRVA